MPDEPIHELPEVTRQALSALGDGHADHSSGTDPLEERIVAGLRSRGLLRSAMPSARARGRSPFLIAAAAVLLLSVGVSVGRASVRGSEAAPTHVLLLRGGARVGSQPADDSTTRAVYSAWAQSEGVLGSVVGGEELAVRGTRLALGSSGFDSTEVGSMGPGAADIVGYFLLRAASRDQALEIARRCPHLRFGGTVELREIVGQ